MNITDLVDFKIRCTGCTACASVCEPKSINMKKNEEGFLFPQVNENLCVDCGKCLSVCSINNDTKFSKHSLSEIYAFQADDYDLLMNSTSGGLFPVLANNVIKQGGVVFGATYNDEMSVVHSCAETEIDVKKFHGSKDVQSELGDTFKSVEAYLKQNKLVLFSGTPCQINGLKLFLGKQYDNLLTVDVICYGVPGELFFKKYIELIENKESAKVIDFKFRDKHKYGWSHTVVITFKNTNGKVYSKIYGNEYNNLWYRAWKHCDCLRESCYNCEFVSNNRVSDFTIGNFWGIGEVSDSFNVKNGVSLLAVNNKEKYNFYAELKNSGIFEEQDNSMLEKYQHGLSTRKERTGKRDSFYINVAGGYMNLINSLYPLGLKDKIMFSVPIRFQKTVIGIAKKIGGIK